MPRAETQGIVVEIESQYLADRSDPSKSYYFFSYDVRIANVSSETAQLLERSWLITDANGEEETVTGPGVVGEQPVLRPGTEFRYTSFCPLRTEVGSMQGSYSMVTSSGEQFEAEIPVLTLALPNAVN